MTRSYLLAYILFGSLSFAMPASGACVRPVSLLIDATVMAPIFDAIEANQPEQVRKALADGAPPNEPRRTSSGEATNRTPLIEAISQGNAEIVFDLIAAGADPNLSFALDSDWSAGVTPLGFAISRGDSSIVSILVRSLADMKNVSCDGEMGAQTYAAGFAYPEIVSLVTRDQVEPEALARVIAAIQRDNDPRAEIDFLSDQVEVLRQLVEVSFDPSSTIAAEAILQSVKSGRVDLTKVLLEVGVSSDVVDEDTRLAPTLLQISALRGDLFMVNALLASGADPMIVDAFGNSALAYAAAGGDTNIISSLAEGGAPLTANSFGQNALMFASEASAVRALSELGLDPNAVDEFGRTALTLAVSPTPILPYPGAEPAEDNVAIAEALLSVGADPSHADAQGITALMAVARGRAIERAKLAEVLIAADAPLDGVDIGGSSVLHHFADTGDIATMVMLVDAGAEQTSQDALGRTLLHRILETDEILSTDRAAVLSVALEQGVPPDAADYTGQSPLHIVAQNYFEDAGSTLAKLLIEANANPNSKDAEGRTPLMIAIPPDNRAVFLTVGQADGVDLDATAHNSLSALAIAASHDESQFVDDLLMLGADATLVTPAGDTPLHIALASGAQSAALALIEHQRDALPGENELGRTPLHVASQMNLHDATTALLRLGANICQEDSSGNRAIDYAQRPLNDEIFVRQIPPLETYVVAVEKYQRERKAFFDDLQRRLERERLRPISPPGAGIRSAERLHSGLTGLLIPPLQIGPPTPSLFSLGEYDQAVMICTVYSIPDNLGSSGPSTFLNSTPQCIAEFIRSGHVNEALREQKERTSPTWSMLWALDTAFLDLDLLARDKVPPMPGTGAPLPADYPTVDHLAGVFRDARADGLWGRCNGRNMYFAAAEFGKESILNQWHRKLMPLGILNSSGLTASTVAQRNGHGDAVSAIEANADRLIVSSLGPLSVDAFVDVIDSLNDGEISTALLFVESSLDPNALNGDGLSPLMAASREGDAAIPVLRNLLYRGASPDLRDRDGATALHYAASAGQLTALQALYEAGGTLDTQNVNGRTPRDLAQQLGHDHIVSWIDGL